MVTHPFHALSGRRLRVLFSRRRWCGVGIEFVCELDDARRVGLRQEWTDRGPEAGRVRLSAETLGELRTLADAIASRAAGGEEAGDAPTC